MLLGLPEQKTCTKFSHLSTWSHFLLLILEECEGGNERKGDRKMCFSFKDCVPEVTACSSLTETSSVHHCHPPCCLYGTA